jgi:hypothetical protein
MANYLLAYTGGGMAATEAEREQAMAAWGQWFGKLGSAVVAPGNPVGASTSVSASGSNGGAAAGLVADCPIIAAGGKVDVYETIEVM